ncbi:phosphoglycerate mutase family protein [Aspergillus oryzae 100-8]|nr:phosphoglycerate mutase family protein [Aspergillus oryzae 100-8]
MSPTIHCVRHEEGFHNVGGGCTFFDQSKISLMISSPMCRTHQTAPLAFQTALTSTLKPQRIVAFSEAQGLSGGPCDIGSDPDILRRVVEREKWPVNLSFVKDGWNQKKAGSRYSQSNNSIRARARDARLSLREDSYHHQGTGWHNCETRAYVFEHDFRSSHDQEAWLMETRESRWERGKVHPMYGKKDQVKLFTAAM